MPRDPMPFLTLLLVDDSAIQRKVMERQLTALGHRVATAKDGHDAWLQVQAEPPDAVISDVVMSGMDGFALCRLIQSDTRFARIPVILTTAGEVKEGDRLLAQQAGAVDLVKREVDMAAILDVLARPPAAPPVLRAAFDPDQRFAVLRQNFVAEGRVKAHQLLDSVRELGELDAETRARLTHSLHRWAGVAGTYGIPHIGPRAAALDSLLEQPWPAVREDMVNGLTEIVAWFQAS